MVTIDKDCMKIDWRLTGLMCWLTLCCVKAISMGVAEDVAIGIDVTKIFDKPFRTPTWNSATFSAAYLRVAAQQTAQRREEAKKLLDEFLAECVEHTKSTLLTTTFRLEKKQLCV
eukprot:3200953-Amphidinium_carterae.1